MDQQSEVKGFVCKHALSQWSMLSQEEWDVCACDQ